MIIWPYSDSSHHSFQASWEQWQNWTPCAKSCGIGSRKRYRFCNGGKLGDAGCEVADAVATETCNASPIWEQWQNWTQCTKSCDTGSRKRFRFCNGGELGDKGCEADAATSSEKCTCPTKGIINLINIYTTNY